MERPYFTKEAREILHLDKVPLVVAALMKGESQRSISRRLKVSRRTVQRTALKFS